MRFLLRVLALPFRLFWRLTGPGAAERRGGFWVYSPLAVDGDTIWHDGRRIRIWGIDAPEMAQSQGPAAKRQLANLCKNRRIWVVPKDRDVYGRVVARLHYGRGDIGQGMVASGYALATSAHYRRDEKRARKTGSGLWRNGQIADPRAHRNAVRSGDASAENQRT